MRFACVILLGLLFAVSCSGGKTPEKQEIQISKPMEVEPLPPEKILGPMESIKDLDRKVESYKTGANLTPEDVEANRKLKQEIIRGTFDIKELCRLAMDA